MTKRLRNKVIFVEDTKMKKDIFGNKIKLSTVLTVCACAVVAFMLWLLFNI